MKRSKSVKDVFLSFVNGKQKDKTPSSSTSSHSLSSQSGFNGKNGNSLRTGCPSRSLKDVRDFSSTLPLKTSSHQLLNERKNSFLKSKRESNFDCCATMPRTKHKQFSSLSSSRLDSIKKLPSFRKKNNSGCKSNFSSSRSRVDAKRPYDLEDQSPGVSSGQSTRSSEKLLSCLEKLEKMSMHLNYINDATNKLGEIQTCADSKQRLSKTSKTSLKQQFFGKRKKRKQSVETSSDDSCSSISDSNQLEINSIPFSATGSASPEPTFSNTPSYFSSSDDSSTAYCYNSASSGYCSENNRLDQPPYYSYYYSDSALSMDPYDYSSYYGALPNQDIYMRYGSESSYSYAGSASSNDGYVDERAWIYLPFSSQEELVYHYNVFQDPYSKENMQSSLYEHGQLHFDRHNWEGNSETDKVSSKNSDIKTFGSFRYRNGERTLVGSHNAKSGKRVRFSKTVEKKEDKNEKVEEQQLTSKSKEENEDKIDQQSSSNCVQPEETRSSLSHQPIYEFPSGHIEQSCMCFDCILARQSSQLQPTENYAYY